MHWTDFMRMLANSLIATKHIDISVDISKKVFTREILSRDETRPWTKSSLSMVKCLLLFTRFCRDEISSRDELIPVKETGMKFHTGMKKIKKVV